MHEPERIRCEGFDFEFDPEACRTCPGRCCNGESGHVFVDAEAIAGLARFLGLTVYAFADRYLRRVDSRYSLRERCKGDNYACVFFDEVRNHCSVYRVRPEQCRRFPFWDRFRERPGEVLHECPGVSVKRKRSAYATGD